MVEVMRGGGCKINRHLALFPDRTDGLVAHGYVTNGPEEIG